jgi:hypothetical protein
MTIRKLQRFYEGEGSGSNTPSGGQAPQGSQTGAGQPGGQAPSGGQSATDAQDVANLPEWARGLIGTLRNENAGHRTKLTDLETKVKKYDDEKLSESEKLQKAAKEAEDRANAKEAELRSERLTLSIEREARKLNIVDPEMAALAIQGKVQYDADGKPTNVSALLADLVKAKPFLLAQEGGGGTPPSNPSRGGNGYSIEDIKKMSAQQIAALPEGEYRKVMEAAKRQ